MMLKTIRNLALAFLAPAVLVSSSYAASIGIINGSFESPVVGPGFVLRNAGSPLLTGWEITAGSIDHIGTYWEAAAGIQSVDLTGSSLGTIRQLISVPISGDVTISFAMAGNPDDSFKIKTLEVSLIGNGIPFSFDAQGFTRANMGWEYKTATFSGAVAGDYYLQFKSTTTDGAPFFGAALDDVSASVTVPEGGMTVVLLGMSITAMGLARRFVSRTRLQLVAE